MYMYNPTCLPGHSGTHLLKVMSTVLMPCSLELFAKSVLFGRHTGYTGGSKVFPVL